MVDMSNVKLRVENMVATVNLFTPLNLDEIMEVLPNSRYNPEEFPGVICHLDEPGVALLLFNSGKCVVTGAKSVDDIQATVSKLVEMLSRVGVKFHRAPEISIQNMVFSGDLGMEFNLDIVALVLPNCEFEPEIFPGVIYRVKEPKAVILLFSSGRIVCSGAKSEHSAWEAVK
ncbi:TATA-box-binding protein, partial [Thermococcus sp. LS2]|uniref:TATA-box-binding protein n=1 Tax=Thermococcus sp. LS2 TaxID=1638260 RepID=UPI0014388ADA|nr:TATA-box-binding protein [Thermococcus sp. LS2]